MRSATLDSVDIDAYLDRIAYSGPRSRSAETLAALQEAHLLAVPFENLDIHRGTEIVLDELALFRKVVQGRRGGFCYELNGLFARLLDALGFAPLLLSAGVTGTGGRLGPEFDHLALMVALEERWLVDVGFGDAFRRPLRLDARGPQADPAGAFRIVDAGGRLALQRKEGDAWMEQYRFSLFPRALADFSAMCRYHQTSPDSHFTRNRVCTLALPNGRLTLSGAKLITTRDGERTETTLDGDDEVEAILAERFGVRP